MRGINCESEPKKAKEGRCRHALCVLHKETIRKWRIQMTKELCHTIEAIVAAYVLGAIVGVLIAMLQFV